MRKHNLCQWNYSNLQLQFLDVHVQLVSVEMFKFTITILGCACATCVSETVQIYDYNARNNIVISAFVPELRVLDILAFRLVDPV
jgi:hypothetical protein